MPFRAIYIRRLNESYKAGTLSKKDYDILLNAYTHPRRHNDLGEKINLMSEVEAHARKRGWPEIWKWIKENWMTILKLILSLLPLFLMVDENQF